MFVSAEYWVFVLVVLALHNLTGRRLQNVLLLAASYIVYFLFDPRFLWLLWVATVVNFGIALLLQQTAKRRLIFWVGIVFNIGLLALCELLAGWATGDLFAAVPLPSPIVSFVMPLAISFYSFRFMSYVIDVYRGKTPATRAFIDFALYGAFFPQLAAGPIERSQPFLSALAKTRRLTQEQFVDGLTLIFMGLFYKIAIADPLVPFDALFDKIPTLTSGDALAAVFFFGLRLYADFVGYSLIAVGLSTWFGLPAMENFRQPYFALGFINFWTRWHISLSTWFRDYWFYPVSRFLLKRTKGQNAFAVQTVAYFSTMMGVGLWHGLAARYVIWGALHAFFISAERTISLTHRDFGRLSYLLLPIRGIVTFSAVNLVWVFFRVPSVSLAFQFYQRLLDTNLVTDMTRVWGTKLLLPIILLLSIEVPQLLAHSTLVLWRVRLPWRIILCMIMVFSILVLGNRSHVPFIYTGF